MNRSLIETVMGAVVIGAAAIFLSVAYKVTGNSGPDGYPLLATFTRAEGLNSGADVRVGGVKIGSVSTIELTHDFRAKATLNVDGRYNFPTDSEVAIKSEGLLGGVYVAIEPGGEEEMLKPGDEFARAQSSVSIQDLIARAIFSSAEKKDDKKPAAPAAATDAATP